MKWARRFGTVLTILGVVSFTCPLMASANYAVQGGDLGSGADQLKQYTVTASEATSTSTIPVGTVILGFKLTSTGATAACGIYDASGLGAASTTTLIDEVYEDVTFTSDVQFWPKPHKIATKLVFVVGSGACTVYY